MRFLLSVILSSLYFIAPVEGNAHEIRGKQFSITIEAGAPGTELTDHSITDKNAEAIIPFNQGRSSLSQFRFQSPANLIDKFALPAWIKFRSERQYLVQPYLYFKPIGLKLIFPEHYYW